jgi:hypothetical protein
MIGWKTRGDPSQSQTAMALPTGPNGRATARLAATATPKSETPQR